MRSEGERIATKEEVRRTQIDRCNAQKDNDVDPLHAVAKLFVAFMLAERN